MKNVQIQRNPVYQQLNDRFRKLLAIDFKRGDQFLAEREIADRFHLSRPTATMALPNLDSEGLLEFRRGVGPFVNRDVINYDVQSLVSYTEKAKAAGKRSSTELLTLEITSVGYLDDLSPLW